MIKFIFKTLIFTFFVILIEWNASETIADLTLEIRKYKNDIRKEQTNVQAQLDECRNNLSYQLNAPYRP